MVDDEDDILEPVRCDLARTGCSVVAVASGEDAPAASRTQLPDAVVLDLQPPRVDGLEVGRGATCLL